MNQIGPLRLIDTADLFSALLLFKMKGENYGGCVPDLKEIHSVTFYRGMESYEHECKLKM